METLFYLIRHAESENNARKDIMGGNPPLTEKGRQQAKQIAQKLKNVEFDAAFSSDLQRAVKTAEIILEDRNIPLQQLPLLRERHWGELEHLPSAHVQKRFQNIYDAYHTFPPDKQWNTKLVDTMESPREAVDRLITFLQNTGQAHGGKTILVVNHGALMRTLLVHLGVGTFGNFPPGSVKNTALIKLIKTGNDFKVIETEGIVRTE